MRARVEIVDVLGWNKSLEKVVYIFKVLEYVAGMMYMNTYFKSVLDFRGVFDPAFYLLWRSDIMCRMGQYLP